MESLNKSNGGKKKKEVFISDYLSSLSIMTSTNFNFLCLEKIQLIYFAFLGPVSQLMVSSLFSKFSRAIMILH